MKPLDESVLPKLAIPIKTRPAFGLVVCYILFVISLTAAITIGTFQFFWGGSSGVFALVAAVVAAGSFVVGRRLCAIDRKR